MGNALMETAGDLIGGILSLVLGLAFLGFLLYIPFWLLGKLKDRVASQGIWGVVPGAATRVGGIRLRSFDCSASRFSLDYPGRYRRARKALANVFRQPDPGALSGKQSGNDCWRAFKVPQWSASEFDTPYVHVEPHAVQAMDISPRRCTMPGVMDDLADGEGAGWTEPGSNLLSGSQFKLCRIEAGAECAGPGLKVVFRATGKGTLGNPRSLAECPCLYLLLEVAGWSQFLTAVPLQDKPHWEVADTVGEDLGIMDFAGEIPFVAQIVLFPSGRRDDFSHMVPLSNVVVGTIEVHSKKIPL